MRAILASIFISSSPLLALTVIGPYAQAVYEALPRLALKTMQPTHMEIKIYGKDLNCAKRFQVEENSEVFKCVFPERTSIDTIELNPQISEILYEEIDNISQHEDNIISKSSWPIICNKNLKDNSFKCLIDI